MTNHKKLGIKVDEYPLFKQFESMTPSEVKTCMSIFDQINSEPIDADYDRNVSTWETESGDGYLIKDLKLGHFVNILNWMNKCNYDQDFIQFMENEASVRAMNGFLNKEKIPVRGDDGVWTII